MGRRDLETNHMKLHRGGAWALAVALALFGAASSASADDTPPAQATAPAQQAAVTLHVDGMT